MEPTGGFEPPTCWLRISCSTEWATSAWENVPTLFMGQNQEKISIRSFLDWIQQPSYRVECTGLSGSGRAYLVSNIYTELKEPVIVITKSVKEGEKIADDLRFFVPRAESAIHIFPPYNILPFKFMSYHNEIAAKRIGTLYRMTAMSVPFITITSVDALLQRVLPKMKKRGGYAAGLDHLIPANVSLENFRYFVVKLYKMSWNWEVSTWPYAYSVVIKEQIFKVA